MRLHAAYTEAPGTARFVQECSLVKSREQIDWSALRQRASEISDNAFDFVRDGLRHTVESLHGPCLRSEREQTDERRHVSGQQLCLGLKELAVQRWGLLAPTVLRNWGIRRTDDFGTIVFAMIDRKELKSSEGDTIEDFKGVFDFDEAFGSLALN